MGKGKHESINKWIISTQPFTLSVCSKCQVVLLIATVSILGNKARLMFDCELWKYALRCSNWGFEIIDYRALITIICKEMQFSTFISIQVMIILKALHKLYVIGTFFKTNTVYFIWNSLFFRLKVPKIYQTSILCMKWLTNHFLNL